MNLEESKVLMNIEKYGNTSATLPLVLRWHLLKGDNVFLLLLEDLLGGLFI
jgi:3-oxoacyl-[acyl-carrier-protein] synthase III